MLKGKVAVVTGSTSGIGLGIARALAGAGARHAGCVHAAERQADRTSRLVGAGAGGAGGLGYPRLRRA